MLVKNYLNDLHKKPVHFEKVTVWSKILFGALFIDEDDPDEETLFQQDGATNTSHTVHVSINLIRYAFHG